MDAPIHYPAALALAGRRVLVAGGGEVAARRVEMLLRAGARVRVVAPEMGDGLRAAPVERVAREFADADADDCALVFAATDDRETNRRVAAAARTRDIWVNVADDPDACDFTVPAAVVRGPVVVAVSTSGDSPALAARLRRDLEVALGDEVARFARIAAAARRRLGAAPDRAQRLRALAGSPLLDRLRAGDRAGCESAVREALGPGLTLAELEA